MVPIARVTTVDSVCYGVSSETRLSKVRDSGPLPRGAWFRIAAAIVASRTVLVGKCPTRIAKVGTLNSILRVKRTTGVVQVRLGSTERIGTSDAARTFSPQPSVSG